MTIAFKQSEEKVLKPIERLVYERPHSLDDTHTHYCPGCTHGVAHRLIAEVIDELGIQERAILVAPVGWAGASYGDGNQTAESGQHCLHLPR